MTHPVVVRDPLWNTIELDPTAVRIVDSPAYQRLRYIRQLGLAHLVYPGATHTRFDHALGVYHLARRTLSALESQGALGRVDDADRAVVPLAGLLHDIGHYPFSHALEELEQGILPGDHEAVAARFLEEEPVKAALATVAVDAPARIWDLIRGRSSSPLQGLVSGSLDLDKIEYLKRDARFCGVPYGEVDVDRLIHSLTIVEDPDTGRSEIGVLEKGVAALESLLFAKYQMFRNVYWHHAVRGATVLYRRMVADALAADLIDSEALVGLTDEALLFMLEERAQAQSGDAAAARVGRAVSCLRDRRLPKRAGELKAAEMDDGGAPGHWLSQDSPLRRRAEERLAEELGLRPGEVFLDFPEKPAMFALDLLVLRRAGDIIRLGPTGRAGLIGLPRVSEELYRTARVLRLFTWSERRDVSVDALGRLAALDAHGLEQRLAKRQSLLD
ncbi:MAG TPA: HD domain-containing protein [Longimicrobiales bacterium]|nr:HD domain-containing protein [Longimicrobiales bacterium]